MPICPVFWIANGRDPFLDAGKLSRVADWILGGRPHISHESSRMGRGEVGAAELLQRFLNGVGGCGVVG